MLFRSLEEIRNHGFATFVRTRRVSEEIAMAVPLMVEDRVLATVAVRFSASAVPMKLAVERFVPKLQDTVRVIQQRFTAQQGSLAATGT